MRIYLMMQQQRTAKDSAKLNDIALAHQIMNGERKLTTIKFCQLKKKSQLLFQLFKFQEGHKKKFGLNNSEILNGEVAGNLKTLILLVGFSSYLPVFSNISSPNS